MRFLSLFSGIEAASLAWEPLGWSAAAFAEVDRFASAVLEHRYPHVPNLGDVRNIGGEQLGELGRIDLVVAGFPCQDLSVAGARRGLEHEGERTRSGLFYEAVRIADASRARWLVLENVPGLLSSHGGRDFAAVVGTLAGCEFDVPDAGWRNAGVAAGPRGLVEWSTLDAQFFGVPQRRRRVFLVRDSGEWGDRPPVLLERSSLQGNPPPRREAGEGAPAKALRGATGGIDREDGLNAHPGTRLDAESETLIPIQDGREIDKSQNGLGVGAAGDPAYSLDTTGSQAIAFQASDYKLGAFEQSDQARGLTTSVDRTRAAPIVAGTVRGHVRNNSNPATEAAMHVQHGMSVRRLLPVECERLQGMPDDWTFVPYRGKPASDGPRYKAIGNSIAVPVLRWIGRRIQRVEALA